MKILVLRVAEFALSALRVYWNERLTRTETYDYSAEIYLYGPDLILFMVKQ